MTNGKKDRETTKGQEEIITQNKDKSQRALVFQGGGALAAYEVGVYCTLYFWIKKDWDKNEKNENVFHIVAGTSGGAINGSIIISHFVEKSRQNLGITDSWTGSLKTLLNFWNHISSNPDYSKWGPRSMFGDIVAEPLPAFPYYYYAWKWPSGEDSWKSQWQNEYDLSNKVAATAEAARRYYSAKEYLYTGAQNVFSRPTVQYDDRFFDDLVFPTNTWYRYDNTPLKESIKQYATFPIATTFEEASGPDEKGKKQEPRLLVVSVDVLTGATITFDSYEKDQKSGIRKSEFEDYAKTESTQDSVRPHANKEIEMSYKNGINEEHVLASSSVPINYEYASVKVDYDDHSKGERKFWDGGITSNTPLRELIQAHEDYWTKVKNADYIPDLKVYIANIWPIGAANWDIPLDHDAVKNRLYDLRLQDKTLHEEKVAYLIRDYIDLANALIERAKIPRTELDKFLDGTKGQSKHRNGDPRTYRELLEKKVRIIGVTRIQRKPDPDDISSKLFDYSSKTISDLIVQGVEETLKTLAKIQSPNDKALEHLNKFIDTVERENGREKLEEPLSNILKETNMYHILTGSAEVLI